MAYTSSILAVLAVQSCIGLVSRERGERGVRKNGRTACLDLTELGETPTKRRVGRYDAKVREREIQCLQVFFYDGCDRYASLASSQTLATLQPDQRGQTGRARSGQYEYVRRTTCDQAARRSLLFVVSLPTPRNGMLSPSALSTNSLRGGTATTVW